MFIDYLGNATFYVVFIGDSLTHAKNENWNGVIFSGYRLKLASKLISNYSNKHQFKMKAIGWPGCTINDIVGQLKGIDFSEDNKLKTCQGVIVPYLIGFNDLTSANKGTSDNISATVNQKWLRWRNTRNDVISEIEGFKRLMFVSMTIPSMDPETANSRYKEFGSWRMDFAVSEMNKAIASESYVQNKNTDYSVLTLGSIIPSNYKQINYNRYVVPGHADDGLHFYSEGNEYIASEVFNEIKPWIDDFEQ